MTECGWVDAKAQVRRTRMVVPWRTAKPGEGENHSLPAAAGITRIARMKLVVSADPCKECNPRRGR